MWITTVDSIQCSIQTANPIYMYIVKSDGEYVRSRRCERLRLNHIWVDMAGGEVYDYDLIRSTEKQRGHWTVIN